LTGLLSFRLIGEALPSSATQKTGDTPWEVSFNVFASVFDQGQPTGHHQATAEGPKKPLRHQHQVLKIPRYFKRFFCHALRQIKSCASVAAAIAVISL
jgi:hypothetical protein